MKRVYEDPTVRFEPRRTAALNAIRISKLWIPPPILYQLMAEVSRKGEEEAIARAQQQRPHAAHDRRAALLGAGVVGDEGANVPDEGARLITAAAARHARRRANKKEVQRHGGHFDKGSSGSAPSQGW